ncbi:MAG: hypothetical protein N3A57_06070, partial [Negativicutes bacterium]|nr:hypothetical protein [Negativicutes bacterium]
MRMSSRNSGKLVFTIGPLNVGAANFGQNNSEKMLRTELYVNGRINGDWTYFASLRNDKWFGGVDQVQNSGGEPDDPGNNYTQFRQAYVQGKLLGVGLAVGRQNNTPAYGFVASEDMTGIKMFGGGDVVRWEGFWGNTDKLNNWPLFFTYPNGVDGVFGVPFIGWYDYVYISSWADGWSSIPVSWWDVAASARLSDKWNVKAAWMGARSEPGTLGGTETYDSQGKFSVSNYMMNSFYAGGTSFRTNMNFVEIGTDWTFDEMWRLTGVYSQSVAGVQNTAYSVQLDCNKADINVPGSWHAYLAYRNVQALAGWDSIYSDLPGYNGCGNSWDSNDAMPNIFGARGWEIGFDYVWDRNVQLSLMYNAYSPTVSSVVNPLDGQPDGELDSTEAHIADIGGNNSHFQANFLFFF